MLTKIQRERLIEYLVTHELTLGLGTESACCSMGAINLARLGKVNDSIPPGMSKITASFIIKVQDMMPRAIRNSQQWKDLLPDAADTISGGLEDRRENLIMEWMWRIVAYMQVTANKRGFGSQWAAMIEDRTAIAVHVAQFAAYRSSRVPHPDINNPAWIVSSCMGAVARYAGEVIINDYDDDYDDNYDDNYDDDSCPICASVVDAIASAASAIAYQHENRDQGLLEFWWKVNPPRMLKELIDVDKCPKNTQ
jgi:hypothetical protein